MANLLTVRETAERLNRSYHTVLGLIHAKHLTAVMLPGSREYLVDPADLDALIQASKVGTNLGTNASLEAPKPVETMAPQKRRQSGNEPAVVDGKFQWMQSYEPKRRRK